MALLLSNGNLLTTIGIGITSSFFSTKAILNLERRHKKEEKLKEQSQSKSKISNLQIPLKTIQTQEELSMHSLEETANLLNRANVKLQRLQQENSRITQEKIHLENFIREKDNQLLVLQKSFDLKDEKIRQEEEEVKNLKSEINKLKAIQQSISPQQLTSATQELEVLERNIQLKRVELNDLRQKGEQASQERESLRSEILSKETNLHELQAHTAQFNAKKIETQQTIISLEKKQNSLNEEISSIKNSKEYLDRRVAEIDQKNPDLSVREQLQADIERFFLEKQTLARQVADLRSQTDELTAKKNTLDSILPQLAEQEVKLNAFKEKASQKQEKLEHLKVEYFKLEQKKEQLDQNYKDYCQKLDQSKIEALHLDKQKYKAEKDYEFLEARQQELKESTEFLSKQQQELQHRIAVIKEQQPDLITLETLQKNIEQIRLETSGLAGKKEALQSEVEQLEPKKVTLQGMEAKLIEKKLELEQLNSKYEELHHRSLQLEQKTTELELLRVTYDALFTERQSFEERVKQLRPEIERLELQKQQILQAIKASEQEYLKVEQQREESRSLALEIKERRVENNRSEREARRIEGVIAGMQEESAQLQEERTNSEKRLKQLKGEITELEESAAVALQALRNRLWVNLPTPPRTIDTTSTGEQQFLGEFSHFLHLKGLAFPERVIRAFHTSLKVQDISALAILAGISGTGKSELPQRYADYLGAQMLTLAVQPRWDSPQDLQGFYNYIEKKYKPTDLMRGLYQYQNDPQMRDRLVIVLLDEMNLARVEYYFSDFLSKLETRRSKDTYLELDVGSLPLVEQERRLLIPHQFLFVGTMNEDETTQSLSDKVLDRANVLTFGKPQALKLREECRRNDSSGLPQGYVSYSQFNSWIQKPDPNSELVRQIKSYLNNANQIMEKLGHPFAHRVYQSITAYVVNYPGANDVDSPAFQAALADQFGQKLLPKLRGIMIDECHEELDLFSRLIAEIGDRSLESAFEQAKQGRFGQFQWRGLVYEVQKQD